jgi:dolichyl-phosphate-mannose-protein mannosyltransferase
LIPTCRGQWFSASEDYRIYLLGNPIIWWGHLALLCVFTWIYGYNAFRAQRGYAVPPAVAVRREETLTAAGWLFLGKRLDYAIEKSSVPYCCGSGIRCFFGSGIRDG